MREDLIVAKDLDAWTARGAELFFDTARAVLSERSRFTVVLSGGRTPQPVYERLGRVGARAGLPWERIHFFWGDERDVASDHPESNFHMAWTLMLSRLPLPAENIHRIRTELGSPQRAAADYERTLRHFFGQRPSFDLVFLGLGRDGHTASLFPDGRPGISVSEEFPDRWVISPWIEHLRGYRISLTPKALNEAASIVFLVSGSEKAAILARVLQTAEPETSYPAQAIRPRSGRLTWIVDQAAGAGLRAL